jgi:phage gp29-like protein
MGRYGFRIYREMLHDDTVKACLKFKKVLVHGRSWDVTPFGGKDATDQDTKIAEFVYDALAATNWNRIQREILTCLDFGFSIGEIIWEVRPYEDQGLKVMLKDVHHRDPEYMRVNVDIHGNINEFRQLSSYIPPYHIDIDPNKVLHVAYQNEFMNHYGWSDLRAAYRAWWSKKFVTQFWNVFLERFGSPLMAMKYPQGASDQLKTALQQILTGLQSKTDILVPEGVEIDLIEATRAGQGNYLEALTYFDVGISRAILVPALLGMGVDVKRGSDSQSRLHLRVLMKIANDLASDVSWEVNQKIVKQIVDMNFAGVTNYPIYGYGDYGEYEAAEIADSIAQLFNAGMLDMDQADVNYARSILGLPIREPGDEDEVNRPQPTPLGNPGQGMGGPGGAAGGAGPTAGNQRAKKPAGAKKNKNA